ncbi:CinA family protein [Dinoroseobacter sp. S124A]|uniref:CinA family protein n=1 Tax=Dinoroseobacter sp. S124A TaxID=3415128 RepID=UPI003C7CB0F6
MSAATLVALCTAQGLTVTCAESCTGGMLAAAITDVAGSSAMFERGFVTYSNVAKTEMLGVAPATLEAHGAVSEEVAAQMASGAQTAAGAQIAVAITGIAGPGGSEFKPEGRVCFGIIGPNTKLSTETVEFGALGRAQVRQAARDHAIGLLLAAAQAA